MHTRCLGCVLPRRMHQAVVRDRHTGQHKTRVLAMAVPSHSAGPAGDTAPACMLVACQDRLGWARGARTPWLPLAARAAAACAAVRPAPAPSSAAKQRSCRTEGSASNPSGASAALAPLLVGLPLPTAARSLAPAMASAMYGGGRGAKAARRSSAASRGASAAATAACSSAVGRLPAAAPGRSCSSAAEKAFGIFSFATKEDTIGLQCGCSENHALSHSWRSPWQHHVPSVYHAQLFAHHDARCWQ